MSTIIVEISELRSEAGDEGVKKLSEFLIERTGAKVDTAASEITITSEEKQEALSKTDLRVLLRKFLHKEELKETLRVIGGKENTLIIKKRKKAAEEEK